MGRSSLAELKPEEAATLAKVVRVIERVATRYDFGGEEKPGHEEIATAALRERDEARMDARRQREQAESFRVAATEWKKKAEAIAAERDNLAKGINEYNCDDGCGCWKRHCTDEKSCASCQALAIRKERDALEEELRTARLASHAGQSCEMLAARLVAIERERDEALRQVEAGDEGYRNQWRRTTAGEDIAARQREACARLLEGPHRHEDGNCCERVSRAIAADVRAGRSSRTVLEACCGNCTRADMVRATPLVTEVTP
jgi:hypothetical protein